MDINLEIWKIAQEKKKRAWLALDDSQLKELAEKKRNIYVPEVKEWLEKSGISIKFNSMLQVGCAAVGTIHFWYDVPKKLAIEPLADFFKANFPRFIDPRVDYKKGMGENLPFADQTFDFVYLENVIDHVPDYRAVLQDTFRVLTQGGYVHVSINVPTLVGRICYAPVNTALFRLILVISSRYIQQKIRINSSLTMLVYSAGLKSSKE